MTTTDAGWWQVPAHLLPATAPLGELVRVYLTVRIDHHRRVALGGRGDRG